MKDVENEKKYVLNAIKMDENNSDLYLNYGMFLQFDCRDFENARIYCQKAIELDPENGEICHKLARVLIDMKLYEEAEKYLLKALDIMDGIDNMINGSYAYLLHLMGDDESKKIYTDSDRFKSNKHKPLAMVLLWINK